MKNVKNMIHNMKCYQLKHKDDKVDEDNGDFRMTYNYLINYCQRVAEYEVGNPKLDITKELNEEYKHIVKLYSKYNEEK